MNKPLGPLDGVRVLDLTRLLPGPFATLILADMGAGVDKVEDPHGGDYLRHMPPQVGGQNAAFIALNRGKRSIVLDLKHPAGAGIFERLVAGYDVLVEQFRPGVMDRLGLGHQRLRSRFPRLIIAAITGYGQSGPLASRAGHDIDYLARSGLLGLTGPAHQPPQPPGFQLADIAGGLWAALGIVGALRARDRSGEGAVLDISMTDGTLPFAIAQLSTVFATGGAVRGGEPLTGGIAPYATYATHDGRHVALGALEPKFWRAFCAGVGIDADLSAMIPGEHQGELRSRLAAIFASRTREEWVDFGREHECCLEPVLEPAELESDPHLVARGAFFEMPTPFGTTTQIRLPISPADVRSMRSPPAMGENTDEILGEAGVRADEIAALRGAHVVR